MKILGISCHYHDSAASLVDGGKILAASLEERFTRVKHDSSFPRNAINFCLKYGKIASSDLDYVVFYERPFLKFERIYQNILKFSPLTFPLFRDATISTFAHKLWIRSIISQYLNIDGKKILFLPHHLSHASSAFLCSPFARSAILTIDGVGEWSTASIGCGNEKEIRIIKEMRFPCSLGLLYSALTAFLGFEINEGEYKVMGMAGFGKPKYTEKIYKIIKIMHDGSITPDLSYFSYHYHNKNACNDKFIQLFGKPRLPHSPFNPKNRCDRYYADIAASLQSVTGEIVLKMAKYAKNISEEDNLCLAGGVALNGLSNFQLAKEKIFENIYIQPAAGDAGGAIGAALYADYYFGSHKRFVMDNVYLGEEYNNLEIEKFIAHSKWIPHQMPDDKLFNFISSEIANGKVVGWFDGRHEWGPRALGARSILADPRNPDMKRIVNEKIKFREPFRPFAPSVLEEYASDYFEVKLSAANLQLPTPYDFMLYVTQVKKDQIKNIPAVTHVDGTSRPQLVRKEITPRYWQLINKFHKITGIPMILNTSFNLSSEPIVSSPLDAYKTFIAGGLDILVLGNYVIEK